MPNISTNDPKGSQSQNALVWNGARAVVSASPLAFASLANGQTFVTITPTGAVNSRTINAALAASTDLPTFCAALALELNTSGTTAFTWTATSTGLLGTAKQVGGAFNRAPTGTSLIGGIGAISAVGATLGVTTPSRDLGVIFIGDSHVEGRMTTDVLPVDCLPIETFDWNSTIWNTTQRATNNICNSTNVVDANVGSAPTQAYAALAARFLKDDPRVSRVRSANFGLGGSCSYTWSGVQAHGYFRVESIPADGAQIEAGGQVYTYRTVATAPYDILIGDLNATRLQTGRVIAGEGTGVIAGTNPNPSVAVFNPGTSQYVHMWAVATGAAGNSITISSTTAAVVAVGPDTAPAATLGGGADGENQFFVDNLRTRIPAAFGSVTNVVIGLAVNDATRIGWRGRGYQPETSKLIAQTKALFPGVKITLVKSASTTDPVRNGYLTSVIHPAIDALVAADPATLNSVDFYGVAGTEATLLGDGLHHTNYGYGLLAKLVAQGILNTLD